MKDFLISLNDVRESMLKALPYHEALQLALQYEPTTEWRVSAMTFLRQQRNPRGPAVCLIINIPEDAVFITMVEGFCVDNNLPINLKKLAIIH